MPRNPGSISASIDGIQRGVVAAAGIMPASGHRTSRARRVRDRQRGEAREAAFLMALALSMYASSCWCRAPRRPSPRARRMRTCGGRAACRRSRRGSRAGAGPPACGRVEDIHEKEREHDRRRAERERAAHVERADQTARPHRQRDDAVRKPANGTSAPCGCIERACVAMPSSVAAMMPYMIVPDTRRTSSADVTTSLHHQPGYVELYQRKPWRTENGNAWWLSCQPSPHPSNATHQQFVERSGVRNDR